MKITWREMSILGGNLELSVLEKSQMKTFRTQLWKSVVSIWEILEWKLGMMIIICLYMFRCSNNGARSWTERYCVY